VETDRGRMEPRQMKMVDRVSEGQSMIGWTNDKRAGILTEMGRIRGGCSQNEVIPLCEPVRY
jgi:hypothetical protein